MGYKINEEEATILRKLGWRYEDIAAYFKCSTIGVKKSVGGVQADTSLMIEFWNKTKQYFINKQE